MKILLIEDDIEISEMLCSYLIAENFEVVCAMVKRHVRLSTLVLIVSSCWI